MRLEGVIACDDGRVAKLGEGFTIILCIAWSYGQGPIDGMVSMLRVDGLDASSQIAFLASILRRSIKPKALLLDSLTIAGFNVISPSTIEKLTGIPTVVVYTYKPSLNRLKAALVKNFKDWNLRLKILSIIDNIQHIIVNGEEVYILTWGLTADKAEEIVRSLSIYSRKPEPLRLAHYLASEISRILPQPFTNL